MFWTTLQVIIANSDTSRVLDSMRYSTEYWLKPRIRTALVAIVLLGRKLTTVDVTLVDIIIRIIGTHFPVSATSSPMSLAKVVTPTLVSLLFVSVSTDYSPSENDRPFQCYVATIIC